MHIADRVMVEYHWVVYDQDHTCAWHSEVIGDFVYYVWYGNSLCYENEFMTEDIIEAFSRNELELLYAQYLMEKEET